MDNYLNPDSIEQLIYMREVKKTMYNLIPGFMEYVQKNLSSERLAMNRIVRKYAKEFPDCEGNNLLEKLWENDPEFREQASYNAKRFQELVSDITSV